MVAAAARTVLLREDWNTISAEQRFLLLTDHVDLNAAAASVAADLITDTLTDR